MDKGLLLNELIRRWTNELGNVYDEEWGEHTFHFGPNKSKLKRLRLLIKEVMLEIEKELK